MGIKRRTFALLFLPLALAGAACGSGDDGEGSATDAIAAPTATEVKLGYFANITHAPAIVGIEKGIFAKALGSNVKVKTATFNAGPQVIEALFAGAIDASYIGPNPAVNGFVKSKGKDLRIVAGSTSGGAALVVKPGITSAADLKGKRLATPQLGNTQDVALRSWLASKGLSTDKTGGGDVKVTPQENAQTLDTFKAGEVDGAWVPEPWATRLVQEGGGKVLLNEKELWPESKFVTTHLIVRTKFLEDHPDIVENLIKGHLEAIDYAQDNPEDAQKVANEGIRKITTKALPAKVLADAWANLAFTPDPISASLVKGANDAAELDLIDKATLTGIYDLRLLNKVLKELGQPEVTASV